MKLKLTDTPMEIVTKMSKGNPGAVSVIMSIMKHGKEIDPDCLLEWLGPLLDLDRRGIYGSAIWVMFKDRCGQSLVNMLALMRADQLGLADFNTVTCEEALALVRERLPKFAATIVGNDSAYAKQVHP